jgi:hypothetical protein
MKFFVSYCHADNSQKERLRAHLAPLRREGLITDWHDSEITAGSIISTEISTHLQSAQVFLALVSPDFLNSQSCYEAEMLQAIERHRQGKIEIVAIILEPCYWQSSPLGHFKVLPRDGRPVSEWPNPNNAFLDIAQELRRLAQKHTPRERLVSPTEVGVVVPRMEAEAVRCRDERRTRPGRQGIGREGTGTIESTLARMSDRLDEIGAALLLDHPRTPDEEGEQIGRRYSTTLSHAPNVIVPELRNCFRMHMERFEADVRDLLQLPGVLLPADRRAAFARALASAVDEFTVINPTIYADLHANWTPAWRNFIHWLTQQEHMRRRYVITRDLRTFQTSGGKSQPLARVRQMVSTLEAWGFEVFFCPPKLLAAGKPSSPFAEYGFDVFGDRYAMTVVPQKDFSGSHAIRTSVQRIDTSLAAYLEAVRQFREPVGGVLSRRVRNTA